MSGYTSGKTTHDPRPYLSTATSPDLRSSEYLDDDWAFRPRPEFDNHNPILVGFRDALESGYYDTASFAGHWRVLISQGYQFREDVGPHTQAHRTHARRVLTKLANVHKED